MTAMCRVHTTFHRKLTEISNARDNHLDTKVGVYMYISVVEHLCLPSPFLSVSAPQSSCRGRGEARGGIQTAGPCTEREVSVHLVEPAHLNLCFCIIYFRRYNTKYPFYLQCVNPVHMHDVGLFAPACPQCGASICVMVTIFYHIHPSPIMV